VEPCARTARQDCANWRLNRAYKRRRRAIQDRASAPSWSYADGSEATAVKQAQLTLVGLVATKDAIDRAANG
jgi:hypothetical protein